VNGLHTMAALVFAVSATTAATPNTPWLLLDTGLGVPFNVLMAIAFGAFVGVWNKRVEHKGNLIGAFAVSLIMTLVLVVGIPRWTNYTWDESGYQAVMGMGLALTQQQWAPALIEWAIERFRAPRGKQNVE
jgi:NhaP-type Na+/H+ or K+/H+ antiporter